MKSLHRTTDFVPRCVFGNPTNARGKMPRYRGRDHCQDCHAEVNRAVARLRAAERTAPARQVRRRR